jgi:hypothetical protein
MDLKTIWAWLLGAAAGFGVVVYWLMEHVPWLADLPPRWKRIMSVVVLPTALAVATYVMATAQGYEPAPADWQSMIVGALIYVVTAISQVIHGTVKLPAA